MINQIITYLLDKLIGKYVDNFTSSNVKTGLFQGDVRLENLPLKKSVIEDLTDWPITVKSGLIGRVTLRIPYTQLRTQAWAIMLEDIYIVAAPNFKCQISLGKTLEDDTIVRKLILDSLEAKWRKNINHQADATKTDDNSWLSSVASLGYRVLRNIQIEVRNVHIRYEDGETIPSQTFALGLVVDEFSTKSSDFEWNSKKELKVDASVIHKFLDLKNIRVYLDPTCDGACTSLSPDTIKSVLVEKLQSILPSSYIITPISIHGTMKRQLTQLPIRDQPRISLDLRMEQLELSMTQGQYQTSIVLLNEFDRYERQKEHLRNRPSLSVIEAPRQWWQFAIKENMPIICRGEGLCKRARDIVIYIKSYEDHLLEKGKDGVNFYCELDRDLGIDVIVALREIAMEKAKRRSREMMTESITKVVPSQTGWWAYLWGTKSKEIPSPVTSSQNVSAETTQILEKVLPKDASFRALEQDISDILNEIDHDAKNFFTKDKIFLRGQFSLSGIRVRLNKDSDNPILGVQANNLCVGFESRPSYLSWSVKVALKSLLMQDLGGDETGSDFVDVVSCVGTKNEDKEIFKLAFEVNPLPSTSAPGIKKRLAVTSEPLTIIHCPRLINKVQQFFQSIKSNDNIKAVAQRHIKDAKLRTSASLKEMIEKEVAIDKWHVLLKISAPKLVLPNHRNTDCVILDLGRLQVSNCDEHSLDSLFYDEEYIRNEDDSDMDDDNFVTPMGSLENLSLDPLTPRECEEHAVDNVYEEYSIVLDNVMILVGTWKELSAIFGRRVVRERMDVMLMEPFKLQLSLKRKYVHDNDYCHPNIILETTISRLLVNISDCKVRIVKDCLDVVSRQEHVPEKRHQCHKSYSKFALANERQLFSATFVLHSFIIQLESERRPLAELTLTEVQFKIVQYRGKMCVDLRLLSMIMADARANLGPNLDFIMASHKGLLACSQEIGNPLIVLSYERSGPRNGCHRVSIVFSGLDMIANQETIMELIAFAKQIVSEEYGHGATMDQALAPSTTFSLEFLNLSITCKSVSVLFINILATEDSENRSAICIGSLSLSDMRAYLIVDTSNLSSTVTIRRIGVHDMSTVESLHTAILSLTNGTNEMNMSSSVTEDHIKITITKTSSESYSVTGTMPHFVYIHSPQFIDSVKHCVTNFQDYLTRFKDNLAAAARTAILSSPQDYDVFQLFKTCRIHFQMLSPILVLPRHKTSREVIIAHLGDIDIANDDASVTIVFTDATVIARDLPISGPDYEVGIFTDTEHGFILLTKSNLSLRVVRVNSTSFTGIDIGAEFSSSLTVSLSKNVYEQVLNSLDNIVFDDDDNGINSSSTDDNTVSFRGENAVESDPREIPIRFRTNMPELKVELYPDTFVVCEEPMLRLTMRDIAIEFIRQNKFIKDILFEVDFLSLNQILDSKQRRLYQPLLYSTTCRYHCDDPARVLSLSCPDLTVEDDFFPGRYFESTSLPRQHKNNTQQVQTKKTLCSSNENLSKESGDHGTGSVDGAQRGHGEKLVRIIVRLVDKKIPDFSTTYESVNRFIEASITDLTCRITTDTWVILLDFFGLGSKFFDPDDIRQLTDVSKVLESFNRRYDGQIEEIVNKKLQVQMKQLNILLENEVVYVKHENLAAITVTSLLLNLDSRDGNLNLAGSVENFQLEDLSPTGAIYSARLFPASNQQRLLEFQLFKYGLPDPGLLREEDMRFSITINSPIVYVHTQRFLQELNQFIQNFFQYQDRLSHMRVTSAGRVVDKMALRSSRIRMVVSCQAPLLLAPVSVFSDHIIVVDLGKFSLRNEFKFADKDGSGCLLDEMCIELHDVDLYSAVRVSQEPLSTDMLFRKMAIRAVEPKPLSQKCTLQLTVMRNLDSNISHSSPDWLLNGTLSSVICSLTLDQYRTIRGVLAHNIGENTDHLQRHRFQAFQIDPSLYTNITGVVWLGMKIELCLNDVQLNLLSEDVTLCRMNFLQSRLSLDSFSDTSKTVELACQDISVEDLRYQSYPVNKRPSVFPIVLSRDSSSIDQRDESACQLKIVYTSSKENNKFSVFLNKMKIITIFDWLKASQAWIFTPPFEIISLEPANENQFDKFASLYVQSIPDSKSVSLHPSTVREQYKRIVKEDFKSTEITCEAQESRFFILEQAAQLQSNALIMTVAGSFSYCTREYRLGPFGFNISRLHLASCSMSPSLSNFMSIVNPVKILVETKEHYNDLRTLPSLENVLQEHSSVKLLIHMSVSAFKVRLSFCDLQLLSTILRSLPSQTTPPANVAHQTGSIRHKWSSMSNSESSDNNSASLPLQGISKFIENISFKHLQEQDFISICLIDDCVDADVPLFDIKLNNLTGQWRLGRIHEATLQTSLSMDYYNINSFGWTPIIEPWPLRLAWKFTDIIELQLRSLETLNVDVSSHLLQIARCTHKKWSTELEQGYFGPGRLKRDRVPFVPFLIVNELGCPLQYTKLAIDKPPSYDEAINCDDGSSSESWFTVPDSSPQTLCFDRETTARDKIRYDRHGMHFNSSHRIELAVKGFRKCHPITVDKLGVFYRDMVAISDHWWNNWIRIVIEIVRQGSVQNKIVVRSSLQFHNGINLPLQIRLYESPSDDGHVIDIEPNSRLTIPLFSIYCNVQVKPVCSRSNATSPTASNCLYNTPIDFSEDLISWQVVSSAQKVDKEIVCPTSRHFFNADKMNTAVYLICTVERLDIPANTHGLPGHLITISAPLCIENLLPCDLTFYTSLENSEESRTKITNCGMVYASRNCTVLTSSMQHTTQLSVELDNYPNCKQLTIPGNAKLSHVVLMCLYDTEDRMLELQVKVESRISGPVNVTIFASYWIVNRTSLSLVYAQAGNLNHIAAGQSSENEKASSPMPFPFSFSNNDTYQLVIRLGSKSKTSHGDQLRPNWSPKLSLDKMGTATIQLKAALPDVSRPYLQYNIGLEIRPGKGRHRSTIMVILTSRYLLDNMSTHSLNITQYKCANKGDHDMYITALPKSMLSFHWPRDDLDPLLSIQLLNSNKEPVSLWSGGFRIDQISSFHIYLRGTRDHAPTQLRVTVTLQGARFRVVFTDTDGLPPPYLLQNLTRLQLFFSQIVPEPGRPKYTLLAPNTSYPYALDESTLPANVTLALEGGSHATYNLNTIGSATTLSYENFLYIVVQGLESSFNSPLVFDVQSQNRRVFLNSRKPGSRSQLWYYSSRHELFHEGSIAPHDPKGKFDRSSENHYLLDVDLIAPTQSCNNQQKYQVKLAKADPRREKFQRWHFTADGCLTNKLGMKCCVVSNCQNASVFCTSVPVEKTCPLIMYQDWLRPGSGTVHVSIVTDGPTRVLRIYDEQDMDMYGPTKAVSSTHDGSPLAKIEVAVKLKEVGVFLINHTPEELLYAVFSDIEIEWSRLTGKDHLGMHVRAIQFDNQLIDTGFPCLVYESNCSESSERTAFSLQYERELGHPFDVHVFNSVQVHLVPLNIILEEKLVLKVIQMLLPPSVVQQKDEEDFSNHLHCVDFHEGKKIYVGSLRVLTGTMCLSVITADALPPDLKQIKKLIPYLMNFANAQIPMEPYDRQHVFETSNLIVQSLVSHYKTQLSSQAIKIFGSVDFLGNPIGLFSDITSGMKHLYSDQNLSDMMKHFAHGIGDSTAKICNTASRFVYGMTLDPDYHVQRHMLMDEARVSTSNTAHVKAGFKSFLHGLVGGAMSVPAQAWKGYQEDGSTGLFSGTLKGMVGVVTKPVGGILDLATGSATSFREMGRSSREGQPQRRFEPRCLSSSWKLLPFYAGYSNNLRHSVVVSDLRKAQVLLAKFSKPGSALENVVGLLVIQNSPDSQMKILVSDSYVHVILCGSNDSRRIKYYQLSQLGTPPVSVTTKSLDSSPSPVTDKSVYIKFNCIYDSDHQPTPTKTSGPLFKCENASVAKQVVKLVCEAQCDYLERQMTLSIVA